MRKNYTDYFAAGSRLVAIFCFLFIMLFSGVAVSQTAIFSTPSYVSGSGTDKTAGAKYIYYNVTTVDGVNVDAVVTINAIKNAQVIDVDNSANGGGLLLNRFQPVIKTTIAGGYVEYLFEFYKTGTYFTSNPVPYVLNGFALEALDIDGDEYFEAVIPTGSYYTLNTPTTFLTVSTTVAPGFTRFQGPSGSVDPIDIKDTPYIAVVNYPNVNSVIFRIGRSISGSDNRQSSISFGEVVFDTPIAPIANNDFKLKQPQGPVSLDVTLNDTDANNNIDKNTVDLNLSLSGIQKEFEVPNQGTWSVNSVGLVTFTPLSTFTTDPTPISYKIKDKTGLISNSATITITYLKVITLTATPTQIKCFGAKGSVALSSNGQAPFIYGGDSTTNLSPGTYNYTVVDANGSTAKASATINAAPEVTGSIVEANIEGCSVANAPKAVKTVAELRLLGLNINNVTDSDLVVTSTDTSSGTCPIIITRVYTITDSCGNKIKATQIIKIKDTVSPVFTNYPTDSSPNQPLCATTPTLKFNTYTEISGDGNGSTFLLNEVFKFTNVANNVYALVKINGLKNATVRLLDDNGTNQDSFNPQTNFSIAATGEQAWVEYKVDFYDATTNAPITIPLFYANFSDIDGNSKFSEQNWTESSNDIVLNNPTELTVSNVAPWTILTGGTTEYTGVENTNSQVNVSTIYKNTNSFKFRVGTVSREGSVSSNGRQHSIDFSCNTNYSNPSLIVDEITLECDELKTAEVLTATDNCGNAVVTFTETKTNGSCANKYKLERKWVASDACSNSVTRILNINVVDTKAPKWTTAVDALNTTVQCGNTTALNTAQALSPIANDCGTITYTKTAGAFVVGTCPSSGKYTNTWIAKDACLNTSTVYTQVITIVDTTKPVLTGQGSAMTINCPATPSFTAPIANDNCGTPTITYTDATTAGSPTCAGNYTVTRTWIATDACGNVSSSVSQAITVQDVTKPVITTCANNKTLESNADCKAIVPDFTKNVVATDNCTPSADLKITQSPAAGTLVQSGVTTITITIEDSCGNKVTCEAKLNVTNNIVANNDSGSSVNGSAGGTSFTNVLGNDVLNCKSVKLADVNISFVSSTNPGVTLSGTNVVVAPGTPVGSYSLTYKICEKANLSNCDEAVVTVPVTAATIIAEDDTLAPINGITGKANAGNALANNGSGIDSLNGSQATVDTVTIKVTATATPAAAGAPVPSLDVATGIVSVPAGTPSGNYTISYEICEKLNPTNCDPAVITIPVSKAPIIAEDDTLAPINGITGKANAGNALANNGSGIDSLNGSQATVDTVTIKVTATATPATAGAPVPSLDVETGIVSVPAGTPSGSYTISYEICEKLNPTNCDPAVITIPVSKAPIIAEDDTLAPINGITGKANAGNALANNGSGIDSLNGSQATVDTVVIKVTATATPATTGAPVPSLDVATGIVSVPAGTPSGSYTISYEICEKLNPTNCDPAVITIPVSKAPIIAEDDTLAPINGITGKANAGNALANNGSGIDSLNGSQATVDTVTIKVTATATPATAGAPVPSLDVETGIVSVPAGTPSGSYTISYEICEKLNPTNCDPAVITIPVSKAPIIAEDDTLAPINGITGKANAGNALANNGNGIDSLNGSQATVDAVIIKVTATATPAAAGAPVPSLDVATGIVSVPAGTPSGSYTISYEICEKLNPTNCDPAVITIPVSKAPIIAEDDTLAPINGITGKANAGNALANNGNGIDSLNGSQATVDTVTIKVTAAATPATTGAPVPSLDVATGIVSVPAGTPSGNYTISYEICEKLNPTNCDPAVITIPVSKAPIIAEDDTLASINGITGKANAGNALANNGSGIDSLNGSQATVDTVTIKVTATATPAAAGAPVPSLDVVTGIVSVPAGTPSGSYTISYEICEKLNPTNCDPAVITIPVSKAPIIAEDDTLAPINGITGKANAGNALANNGSGIDSLNGSQATVDTVTIKVTAAATPATTGAPVPSLDVATGIVSVPAGTPSGSYTISYEICEKLNPTNCDPAVITIPVSKALIIAEDDTLAPINGITGKANAGNALANNGKGIDSLNGSQATVDTVTIKVTAAATPATTGAPVPSLDVATGIVSVPAGTPSGSYTISYEICEKLNPTNCDPAVITIPVYTPSILITKDGEYDDTNKDGVTNIGDKVLYTFVVKNNGNVILTDVKVTDDNANVSGGTLAELAVNATDSTTFTAVHELTEEDIYAGVVYNLATVTGTPPMGPKVTDTSIDPTPCATCPIKPSCPDCTITKLPNNTLAQNDINNTYINTPVIGSVSTNDIDPQGHAQTVTAYNGLITGGTLVLKEDGTYVFTPTKDYTGTTTYTYTVCDNGFPVACAEAVLSIEVLPTPTVPDNNGVTANNDTATTEGDKPVVVKVLANDFDIDGDSFAITSNTAPSNGTVVNNGDGTFTYTANPGFTGIDSFTYEICDDQTPAACDSAVVTVTVKGTNTTNDTFANDDAGNGNENEPIKGNVLTNDTDPEGNKQVVTANTQPSNGVVTVLPTGEYVYTPILGYYGPDSFTYTVCDDGTPKACDIATVYLTVNPINVTYAENDINNTYVNTPVSGSVSTNDNDPDGDKQTVTAYNGPITGGILVLKEDGTYVFTPTKDYTGTTTYTYTVCDNGFPVACAEAVLSIEVLPTPTVPDNNGVTANNDTATTEGDKPVVVKVLANDFDIDGDSFAITSNTAPSNGTVVNNGDGTFTYTANPGFTGIDSFTYEICDDQTPAACDSAVVTVTVKGTNTTNDTFANDDAGNGNENEPIKGNVLTNDTDPEGNKQVVTANTQPSNGVVTVLPTGEYVYTPILGYYGPDSFTYTVCDDGTPKACDIATVYLTVNPINVTYAENDINNTYVNTPVSGSVSTNDNDPDGDKQTVTAYNGPITGGTLVLKEDGTYVFTPTKDYTGTTTYTYTVCDNGFPIACAEAVLNIEVLPTPTVADNNGVTANNDTATTEGDKPLVVKVLANDFDIDGDSFAITSNTAPSNGTVVNNGDGTFTYTANPGFTGVDIFTYEICDNGIPQACDSAVVTVTVKGTNTTNDTFANDDAGNGNENEPIKGNVLTNDTDPEGNKQVVTANTQPSNGVVTVLPTGEYVYTPILGYYGPDSFTYTVCDDGTPKACDIATVYLTVNPINVTYAENDINNTYVNTPVSGSVSTNDNDPDGDKQTVTAYNGPITGGILVLKEDGTYVFTPTKDYTGTTTYTYTLCDNGFPVACAEAVLSIEVLPTPTVPDNNGVTANNDTATTEGDKPVVVKVLANDFDIDGDSFAITSNTAPSNGTVVNNGDGTFTYTANPGFTGIDSFNYEICDDQTPAACDSAVVTVTVKGTNTTNDTFANDDAGNGNENEPIKGNVLTNDTDPEGNKQVVTANTQPSNGVVTVLPTGEYVYTPTLGYYGPDSFTYTVCDDGMPKACDIATVYLTVNPINVTYAENDINNTYVNTPVSGSVSTNDNDPDGDKQTVTAYNGPITGGTLVLKEDGTYVFTPTKDYTGTTTYTYTVCDNGFPVACAEAVLSIEVLPTPTVPDNNGVTANNDTATTEGDKPVVVKVLANDFDIDGDSFAITSNTAPSNGTVVNNGDGTFTYTANPGFTGVDTFTYEICDNGIPQACDSAVVKVTVNPVNPLNETFANDDAYNGNGPIKGNVLTNDTDPEGDQQVVTTIGNIPTANGNVVMNPDGTFTYTPNAGYFGTDQFVYTVCDNGTPKACDTATVYLTVNPNPSISITKDGEYFDANKDGITNVGDRILYTFVVKNTGNVMLKNVTVTDNNAIVLGGPLASLAVGGVDSTTFTASYAIKQEDINRGVVYNLATATGTPPVGIPVKATSTDPTICDVCPIDPTCLDCTMTPLERTPSIRVVKTGIFNDDNKDGFTQVNETITYHFEIINTGNVPLFNVSLSDLLPGLVLSGSTIPVLDVNVTNDIEYVANYTITRDDIIALSVSNQASVKGFDALGNEVTDISSYVVDLPIIGGVKGCDVIPFKAVSPNGDGDNDVFYISGLDCYPDNSVEIYNRWGVLVFERDNYNNTDRAFKGISEGRVTVSQSTELPTGTYYYIFRYRDIDSNAHEKAGYLYLNR